MKHTRRARASSAASFTPTWDGIFTTEPAPGARARKLDVVTYADLELASVGANVLHSRRRVRQEIRRRLQKRSSFSDVEGTWIVPEASGVRRVPVCGAALVKDEARINLDGVPDEPGVSHRVLHRHRRTKHRRGMIAQNVRPGRRAGHRFTVLKNELANHPGGWLRPLAAELGATVEHEEDVSKVSVVGTACRTHTALPRRMFSPPVERPA